jgi:hypothetical protein
VEQEQIGGSDEAATAPARAVEATPAAPIAPHILRVALAIEYLLALIATTVVWEEIGGQGLLDLMPWYTKLGLIGGFCWALVGFSGSLARPGRWRTRRSVLWLCAMIVLATAMGLVTYYYHLHEPTDDDDDDDAPTSAAVLPTPARIHRVQVNHD